jgi:hypothetical protein
MKFYGNVLIWCLALNSHCKISKSKESNSFFEKTENSVQCNIYTLRVRTLDIINSLSNGSLKSPRTVTLLWQRNSYCSGIFTLRLSPRDSLGAGYKLLHQHSQQSVDQLSARFTSNHVVYSTHSSSSHHQ